MKYREIVRQVEHDGWRLVRTVGSHLQYRHPTKADTVTISAGGKLSRDVPIGALQSIRRQAGLSEAEAVMDYVIVIERAEDASYSAYVPDLPGCIACGDTPDEARTLITEAVQLHIASLREHGEAVPSPAAMADIVHAV